MRILRVRRGFTTNSSGASEFLPPSESDGGERDGGTTSETGAGGHRDLGTTPRIAKAAKGALDGGHTIKAAMKSDPIGPRTQKGLGNAATIGIVALVVMLLFLLERALRLLLRRRKKDTDADPGDET